MKVRRRERWIEVAGWPGMSRSKTFARATSALEHGVATQLVATTLWGQAVPTPDAWMGGLATQRDGWPIEAVWR